MAPRHRQTQGYYLVEYILRLYITGTTPSSQRALANLHRICAEELDAK